MHNFKSKFIVIIIINNIIKATNTVTLLYHFCSLLYTLKSFFYTLFSTKYLKFLKSSKIFFFKFTSFIFLILVKKIKENILIKDQL